MSVKDFVVLLHDSVENFTFGGVNLDDMSREQLVDAMLTQAIRIQPISMNDFRGARYYSFDLLTCTRVTAKRPFFALGCTRCHYAVTYHPQFIGGVMTDHQHQCAKCCGMMEQLGFEAEQKRDDWIKEVRDE